MVPTSENLRNNFVFKNFVFFIKYFYYVYYSDRLNHGYKLMLI